MNKFKTAFNNILSAKLTNNNIENIKSDSGLIVKLANTNYNLMLINSETGEIYLSNDFKNSKKLANLKNYNPQSVKEAAVQADKKLNSIQKLLTKLSNKNTVDLRLTDLKYNKVDLRPNVTDLRSNKIHLRNNKIKIAYIDGKVFEGKSHASIIADYLQKHQKQIMTNINKFDINDYIYSIALGEKIDNQIILNSLNNTRFNIVATRLNEVYNTNNISLDQFEVNQTDLRPSRVDLRPNRTDLRNINASHDVDTRDHAIVLINGNEIREGETHAEAINEYIKEITNDEKQLNDSYQRPISPNGYGVKKFDIDDINKDDVDPDQYDTNLVDKYINSLAFAHYCDDNIEHGIYIEEYSLYNISLEEAIKKFKQEYPDMDIYSDDEYDENDDYKLLANIRRRKIASIIKQSSHDIDDRKFAIAVIDGEVYTADTHGEAIDQYLKEKAGKSLSDTYARPPIAIRELPDATDNEIKNMDSEMQDMYNIDRNINKMAFAHFVDNNEIYIESYSLYNMTLDEAVKAIKTKYPDAEYYNDDVYLAEDDTYERLAKVSRLKNVADFYDKRNRDIAILIIDGEIFESSPGGEHYDIIKQYYNNKGITDEKQIDKLFEESSFAMGSKVGNTIYFDEIMVSDNITEDEIESICQSKYSDCKVEFIDYDADAMSDYIDTYRNSDEYKQKFNV